MTEGGLVDDEMSGREPVEYIDSDTEALKVADYMAGMPRLNIGALVMPPIWGPAKGIWATILWYPLWVFADNCIYAWWSQGTALATVIGIITVILLVAVTVAFAVYSTPYAALRAIQRGKTKEEFKRTETIWAVASILLGVLFLAFATYYNLCIRTPLIA